MHEARGCAHVLRVTTESEYYGRSESLYGNNGACICLFRVCTVAQIGHRLKVRNSILYGIRADFSVLQRELCY